MKVALLPKRIDAFRAVADEAGAKVLHDDPESYIVELTDSEARLNRFIATAGNHGEVLEVVRTGALAVSRGTATLHG